MMKAEEKFSPGLDGIVAAETKISFLDTVKGEIVIQGYDLIELSKTKEYLDIVHLLLEEHLPNEDEKATLEKKLKEEYAVPEGVFNVLKALPKETHPMDGLRTGVSALAGYDNDIENRSLEVNKSRGYKLLSKVPNIVANSYHILNNEEPIEPLKELSYSANFFYMLTGKNQLNLRRRSLIVPLFYIVNMKCQTLHLQRAAIASTQSDLYGALTGAVASLKGSLHGGANEAVMYMLLEAGNVEKFEELLQKKLYNKEKIMGFGHRVYMKKMDPRALMMKEALKQLCDVKVIIHYMKCVKLEKRLWRRKKEFIQILIITQLQYIGCLVFQFNCTHQFSLALEQ